jgi:hypothetical protein
MFTFIARKTDQEPLRGDVIQDQSTNFGVRRGTRSTVMFALGLCLVAGLGAPTQAWSVDAAAATALLEESKCVKCHAMAKKKDGPAYRDVAAKFRGDPEAEKNCCTT